MDKKRYMRDAIHSFISFKKDGLVNELIDTEEFQRLKYIHQLGLSYFTYPSALHSRFSHSLGTYWLSERFGKTLEIGPDDQRKLSLAALLHDIGHSPFSHVLEKKLIHTKTHEQIAKEIIESKNHEISPVLIKNGIDPKEVTGLLTPGATTPKYLHKLISSQTDVDRFDYLLRDSLMTGNPHGQYDIERIIRTIRLNEEEEIYIDKGGWNAIEYYLVCRYQMHKQVYYHHSTLAAEELVKKIIDRAKYLYENGKLKLNKTMTPIVKGDMKLSEFLGVADFDILNLIRTFRKTNDKILSELCNRFFKRRLFKSIELVGDDTLKPLGKEKKISSIIKKNNFDMEYYYSTVNLSTKRAYMPYTPRPRDKENSIFINPDCTKEISEEIPSLEAIKTQPRVFLFMPTKKCIEEVKKVL